MARKPARYHEGGFPPDQLDWEWERIIDLTRSQHAMKALDFLFARPVFSTSSFVHESGIPEHTAKK